jgi:GMP synthase-like glutamine amidotransferase
VKPAARKEVGWTTVQTLAPEIIEPGPWLEFHGDQCHLPPGARLLASNDLCVQAFAAGRHLAVQFHPEVDRGQLSGWLDAGARADAERAGQHPERFLAETLAQEPAARARADRLVRAAIRLSLQSSS